MNAFWQEMELHKLGLWLLGYLAWFTAWRLIDESQAIGPGELAFVMGCFTAAWTLVAYLKTRP